jgi:hypothetical protein
VDALGALALLTVPVLGGVRVRRAELPERLIVVAIAGEISGSHVGAITTTS